MCQRVPTISTISTAARNPIANISLPVDVPDAKSRLSRRKVTLLQILRLPELRGQKS